MQGALVSLGRGVYAGAPSGRGNLLLFVINQMPSQIVKMRVVIPKTMNERNPAALTNWAQPNS
jgi:hypothetical protein